jgi:signal transduction histidine kinase
MNKKDFSQFSSSNRIKSNSAFDGNENGNILFDNKIWIVLHENGQVFYSNDRCKSELKLFEGDDLSKLNSEPDLESLIANICQNNYKNFSFELFVDDAGNSKNYNVELERIIIEGEKYFILVFNSSDDNSLLEDKITNLHEALECGQIPVIITDNNGKIIYATKSFETLLELDLDVIYNNHLSSVLSWYLNNEELANIQAAILKLKPWSTTIYLKGNGEENLVLDLKLNPASREGGIKHNFILTAHDVSYYYQKNKVIKKSEEKLRSIINNISDLLVIFKKAGEHFIYEDANDHFKELFNVIDQRSTKTLISDILPEVFYHKLQTSCTLMTRNKLKTVEFDCQGISDKHYAAKVSFVEDEKGSEEIYILSIRDITDRINHEKQIKEAYSKELQMNRLKTTFLQNMSHELRTPATAVLGYSEIIADCIETEEYEAVQEITKSLENVVGRLINLFSKIIEISEIESDEVEFNRVKLNCNKILKSIYEHKIEEARNKNIELELKLSDTHDLVEVDWCKFEKTLNYITDNAIKFTDHGKVQIKSFKRDDKIVISVQDTGIGMKQNLIDRLIQPFVQEDEDGLTREYEGAGLGLTIAYKYVKLMGGELNIESKKNVGTLVEILLPVSVPKGFIEG